MQAPADPEFDSDVRRRIYEYVERTGAATPQDVLDDVRVEPERPDSKPPRSGTTTRVRMSPATFASHLASLLEGGYLTEDEGRLRVAVESEDETVDAGADAPVTIRLAREDDSDAVAEVIREVASERTHIVAETVAEALLEEPVVRHTRRQSRVLFVATLGARAGAEAESDDDEQVAEHDDHGHQNQPGESIDSPDGEVVGWVHVDGPELSKLRHTAELTVGVREPYRGQGIGSRLLERGLAWADQRGYRKVHQSVPATNDAAVDFLEDRGWSVEAVRPDHYLVDDEFVDEVMLATWIDGRPDD